MKYIFLFICLLGLHKMVLCQEPAFINYTIDKGLASNEVYDILEDSQGYMWFATDHGISKFNGYEFKNFTIRDGLPDNTIFQFSEDQNGKIWLSSFNGILSYIENDAIQLVLPDFSFGQIGSIYVDVADTIWLTSRLGQYKVYHKDEKYMCDLLETTYFLRQIDTTRNGVIVNKIDPKSIQDSTLYYMNDTERTFLFSETFGKDKLTILGEHGHRPFRSRNGFNKHPDEIWMDMGNTVLSVKEDSIKVITKTESAQINLSLSRNTIFVSSREGTKVLDSTNRFIKTYLTGLHVTGVVKDREGGYWFSTISQGVFYATSPSVAVFDMGAESKITHLSKNNEDEMVAISYYVDVYKQGGSGSFSKIYDNELNESEYLTSKRLSDGTLFIEDDLHSLTINGSEVVQLEKKIVWRSLDSLAEFRSFGNKLVIRNKTTLDTLFNVRHPHRLKHFPSYLHKEVIYIPTIEGLLSFDLENRLVNLFEIHGFPKGRVNSVRIDPYDNFWVASNVFGLVHWDGSQLTKISDRNSRYGTMCRHLEIGGGFVWASTEKGLLKVDITDHSNITFYTTEDGLLSNGIRCIYIDDEYVFLGHGNGVTEFPKDYVRKGIAPLIYIDEVRVDGQLRKKKENYILPYNTGPLSINFTGLSYNSNLRYKYRLTSGTDSAWTYTTERNVEFVSIPPGDYSFQVVAINSKNIESEDRSIKVSVTPPFWMTRGFILLIIMFIAVVMFLFIQFRVKKIKKKLELERRILHIEQQALRARMNPHFIFNALNSVQAYVLSNDKRSASKYLSLFSNLIRSILDYSAEKLIPIDNEITLLTSYLALESLRFNKKLTYEIVVSKELDTKRYMIPPLLLQPYVENAILHGILGKEEGGKVQISFSGYEDHILFVIIDDGIGRDAAIRKKKRKAHKSVGMKITADRIDLAKVLHEANFSVKVIDLKNQDQQPLGTRVEIRIPYLYPKYESNNSG